MRRVIVGLFLLAICLSQSASAYWQSRGSNYNIAIPSTPSIAVTQAATSTHVTSAQVVSATTVAVAIGNLLVVMVQDNGTSITGSFVEDSKGNCSNAYTLASSYSGNGTQVFSMVYFCSITAALTSTDTVSYHSGGGSNVGLSLIAVYATGIATSSPQDSATTATGDTNFSTSVSVTSGAPAGQSGELYFCWLAVNGSGNTAASPSGWTTAPPTNPSGQTGVVGAYLINAGTTAQTCASSWASGSYHEMNVVSFKHQ